MLINIPTINIAGKSNEEALLILARHVNTLTQQLQIALENIDAEAVLNEDGSSVNRSLVPPGGKAGQILCKASDKSYDTKWINP